MSLKYSNTTADYLQWGEAMNLVRSLYKDEDYKMSLLIAIGCFWGLRISDMLALHWKQILNVDEFTIVEKKTGKQRTIRINQVNAYIKDADKMAAIYSVLHQNIQDYFNKAGIEIMSPHYIATRDGNEITIPKETAEE